MTYNGKSLAEIEEETKWEDKNEVMVYLDFFNQGFVRGENNFLPREISLCPNREEESLGKNPYLVSKSKDFPLATTYLLCDTREPETNISQAETLWREEIQKVLQEIEKAGLITKLRDFTQKRSGDKRMSSLENGFLFFEFERTKKDEFHIFRVYDYKIFKNDDRKYLQVIGSLEIAVNIILENGYKFS